MRLLFFLLLTGTLTAQQNLSLDDAVNLAVDNSFQLMIAQRNVAIAENNNDWGVAGRYPTIALSAVQANSYTNAQSPAGFLTTLSVYDTGITPVLDVNWTLYNGMRTKFTKQQLETLVNLNEGQVQVQIETVVAQTINAYYNALIQRERLEVFNDVLDLSRDRIEYQEVRREYGQAGSFDIIQTRDAYLNDSTSYLIQLNSYENALRNLKLAMGIDADETTYQLTTPLDYEAPDYDGTALTERMLQNNQQLQNLFVNRELALINTKIQETNLRPTIGLNTGASYNYQIQDGNGISATGMDFPIDGAVNKRFNGFINFSANYTIYNGGVRQINIENAQMEEVVAQLNVEDLRRNLRISLSNTLATYRNQKRLLELTENLTTNARQNIDISEERFRAGQINSFDYRTVQLQYINAVQARLNAVFNIRTTETELLRLIGDLVR